MPATTVFLKSLQRQTYLLQQASSLISQIWRQVQFALQDFVDSLLSVLCCEWWLQCKDIAHYQRHDREWKAARCRLCVTTHSSGQHIIHQGSQTPPIHSLAMSTPCKNLWGPVANSNTLPLIVSDVILNCLHPKSGLPYCRLSVDITCVQGINNYFVFVPTCFSCYTGRAKDRE